MDPDDDPQDRPSSDDGGNGSAPDDEGNEGGRNWQQQSGYGERVLDPAEGSDAAEDQADQAATVQDP
jgi:hypothetical protein